MANEHGAPDLDDLRRELQAAGMVVVPFRDEIHIRRSTLEYIKVRVDSGVLHCEPCIGLLTQAKATWGLLAAEVLMMWALSLEPSVAAQGLVVAFAGILAFAFHAMRYTLAEIATSRVQSVWLDLRTRFGAAPTSVPAALPAPSMPALGEGTELAREESRAPNVRSRI